MVKLYMFRASLALHQELRNCVCNQVSYSIILDSVFCLLRAVSVQGFVGPELVCDGCPLGGVRCERTPPRGQPSHTNPGPTKPCTHTARNKQKTESRIIEYDTWLQTQFLNS